MSQWGTLRKRLKESNRDLDAEFEQFLNESLSEESLSSPRGKSPDQKKYDQNEAQRLSSTAGKPWWESSNEDDSASKVAVETWYKTPTLKEECHESENYGKEIDLKTTENNDGAGQSPIDLGASVTMSKDSLDEVGVKLDEAAKLSDIESQDVDENEKIYSHTNPSGSKISSSASPNHIEQTEKDDGSVNIDTIGNTMNELADKLEFFKQLEDERSNLDYGKLNKQLDEETSITDHAKADDPLQATGAELGNSIFNATETAIDTILPSTDKKLSKEKDLDSKPSLLSKVTLMDSMDSTVGTDQREKIKQIRHKQIDVPVSEDEKLGTDVKEVVHDDFVGDDVTHDDGSKVEEYSDNFESDVEDARSETAKTGTELLNTFDVGELADLQQVLQAANLEGTKDSSHSIQRKQEFDESNQSVIVVDKPPAPLREEKAASPGKVHVSATAQPAVASVSSTIFESKGFTSTASGSVPLLNQTLPLPFDTSGSAQEQAGIALSASALSDAHVKRVLGRVDVMKTGSTGFPIGMSTGFELPVMKEPLQYAGPKDTSFLPQTSHEVRPSEVQYGFSLIPASDDAKTGGEDFLKSPSRVQYGHYLGNIDQSTPDTKAASPRKYFPDEISTDEDTPPPESLKNIKSIVRQRKETQGAAKPLIGRQRATKKSSSKILPRSSLGQRKRTNTEENAGKALNENVKPARRGDRNINIDDRFGWKDRRKEIASRNRKEKSKILKERSPEKLMASVESFAEYLNSYVHSDADVVGRDPLVEDERMSEREIGSTLMSREQALRKEVEHWQAMWQDERSEKERLVNELMEKTREWKRHEQSLNLQKKKEVDELKQRIFVLDAQLKDVKDKKMLDKGKNLKSMTDDELRKLEREIREQDQLLTGYQQENERLYEDLKQAQIKNKNAETQMFKENQKLAGEVSALKEKLERKEGTFEISGTAALGAERIGQLHSQLKMLKSNEQEMKKEMDALESEKRALKIEIKNLERERDKAVSRAEESFGVSSRTVEDMESTHANEINRLNRKLAWYIENQELLDKDAALLKNKNEEIKELKDLVERLEAERGTIKQEKERKEKERTCDAKRIQDLERQVREMEQIIKRRYPNSIPALIYAASSAPGDGKQFRPEDSPKKQSGPSYAFLENQVKKLNREIEEREEEWARSFRVLEQKYNAMQLEYERHVTELKRDLVDEREKVTSYKRTRAQTSSMEKELKDLREQHERNEEELKAEMKQAREDYERKTGELNVEIKSLRDMLSARKNVSMDGKSNKTRKAKRDVSKNSTPVDNELQARLKELHEMCREKDRVIEELRATCSQLQYQRQEMLLDTRNVQDNSREKMDVLKMENRQLREELSQVTVEMDQQRVRYQASLAEIERIARQEREASHDELRSLQSQHRQELENMKQEFIAQHSRSKTVELSNKIAGLEIVIERLKDKLAASAETEADLASKKVQEEVLRQEIRQLKSDLQKAKQFHTPEMKHYSQLEEKIAAMETRYSRREHELQAIIQNLRMNADDEKDAVLTKWRDLLRKKTEETERFRLELDSILSVLEELRQQGVVIPMGKVKHLQY